MKVKTTKNKKEQCVLKITAESLDDIAFLKAFLDEYENSNQYIEIDGNTNQLEIRV